eukprot:scaffold2925_cov62-Phaeocystis_antarctica.AAC.1
MDHPQLQPGSYGCRLEHVRLQPRQLWRAPPPGTHHLLLTNHLRTSTRKASDSAPASTMEPCALAAASRHAISVLARAISTALSARTCNK